MTNVSKVVVKCFCHFRCRTVLFSIPDGSFKSFEYYRVKLLAKETKWTSLEFRTHPTLLEILISKSDFGPVKLPGLSRNVPQVFEWENDANIGFRAVFVLIRNFYCEL